MANHLVQLPKYSKKYTNEATKYSTMQLDKQPALSQDRHGQNTPAIAI